MIPVQFKVLVYFGMAVTIGVMIYAVLDKAYHAGYDRATTEQRAKTIAAINAAVLKEHNQMQLALTSAQAEVRIEEKIVEVERVVERKIPQVVTKIVTEHPACGDLGPDFLSVFNEAISGPAATTPGAPAAVAQPAG